MPQDEGTHAQLPLALRVLREELEQIEACFDELAGIDDGGERDARYQDLLRALDRYLRLEREIFYPVLERGGIEHAEAVVSHTRLCAALDAVRSSNDPRQDGEQELAALHAAFRAHWRVQEKGTFAGARELGDELPGLAIELQEVRSRMKGAYGV